MARFKDIRAQQKAQQEYGGAQLAFHASRSQFALQLVFGRAPLKMNFEAGEGGSGRGMKGAAGVADVDPVAVFQLADALAREDMRLRIAETKRLADALGTTAETYDMPKADEPFTIPDPGPKLVKP